MDTSRMQVLTPRQRRRLLTLSLLRALASTALLVAAYYLAPLNHLSDEAAVVTLACGLVILAAVTTYQVLAITQAAYPGIRAVQSLATTAPLFLLLFAATYFLLAHSSGANFNVTGMTRTDALYFTTTTFATVGYGDIVATSQFARLLVTAQMLLDLLILGVGVRVFIGAVQVARGKGPASTPASIETELAENGEPDIG